MNSKHFGKSLFTLKLIQLSTISNLFPLEIVQKFYRNVLNFDVNCDKTGYSIIFQLS